MSTEQQFWDWFIKNEGKYFFLCQVDDADERERLLDDFLEHLHRYCDKLFFEIGGHPDEKQDLIISAEGNTDFFDAVESLVKAAPQVERWNIIAFKPVMDDFVTEYNGIRLNPKEMYFIPLSNKASTQLGVRIYAEGYDPNLKTEFLTAAYLALDCLLGEKSCALDIGYVEVKSLPSVPERDELIEFTKLRRYVEWHKNKYGL
ncbi:hypothetical protein KXD93_24885 [Mucilaginibacter sp. BJC16-A38]|uniref:hypothetical protein n=1 Tax=Mucilaginibacter phenanthrenivorans TaxID=1234842 RepID=UPI00215826F6|nr:hypothetical protein [Mucilaginibacter phenanthrenivorans]MCR8560917.1 hypothetical protein [Mucilaginibacter phenanthrenivorans]